MATTVPMKGGSGKLATDKCLEFIEKCRDRSADITVKTYQETIIEYLMKDVVSVLWADTIHFFLCDPSEAELRLRLVKDLRKD